MILLVLTPVLQDGRVTHFVAGGSTGGTISGTSKFLKQKNPGIKCILADPKGSVFAGWFKSGFQEVGRLRLGHDMFELLSCR